MAIDKPAFAAPRKTVQIPGQQAQQQAQMEMLVQQQNQQPIEVTPTEDG